MTLSNFYSSQFTDILLTVGIIIAFIGLIIWLVFRINKERYRLSGEKLMDGAISKAEIEEYIRKRILKAPDERFGLAFVELSNYDRLLERYGATQCENIMHVLRERIYGLVTPGGKFAHMGKGVFLLYMRNRSGAKAMENVGAYVVKECSKKVDLADALTVMPEISVGLALYPSSGTTPETLMSGLKVAMVVAKRSGINTYELHTPKLSNEESDEYKHYMEIKEAVEKKQFTLYYQPIIDLKTQEASGVEVLLRWRHPTLGIVSPKDFFDIIETSGDIYWLGLWTFEQMLEQQRQWRISYPDKIFNCHVNLSMKQLMHKTLFDDFRFIMKKFKMTNKEVCFEVSETSVMLKDSVIDNNLSKLRESGFLLAIDNYGDADASLRMLYDLNVDVIKLSRNYITKSLENSMVKDILMMLIRNSKEKGIPLVAEGIEDKAMLNYVASLGISGGQGYYFNKPLPAAECMSNIVITPWKTHDISADLNNTVLQQKTPPMAAEKPEESVEQLIEAIENDQDVAGTEVKPEVKPTEEKPAEEKVSPKPAAAKTSKTTAKKS